MASARGIRAGRAFVELGVNDRLTAGLAKASARLKSFGASVTGIGTKVAAAGAAALIPLAAAIKIFARTGDELDKLAARTGFAVSSLSELGFAAEQTGADMQTLEKGIRTMQRAVLDAERGLSTQIDALELLGLTIDDLRGKKPEEQFLILADALAGIEDPTIRAGLAMTLLGRAGTRLLPLLKLGRDGIEVLRQEARDLGIVLDQETARKAAVLTDTLNVLRRVLKNVFVVIGGALAPSVVNLANVIRRLVQDITGWIRVNEELVVRIARTALMVLGLGIALIALGLSFTVAGILIGAFGKVLGLVFATLAIFKAALLLLVSPVGLVAVAIGALLVAVLRFTDLGERAVAFLSDRFGGLLTTVQRATRGMSDALAGGDISLAAEVLWAGLDLLWIQGSAALRRTWQQLAGALLKTWNNVRFGLVAATVAGLTTIEIGWVTTVSILKRVWIGFASTFNAVMDRITAFAAKRFAEIQGFIDEGFDTEAVKAQIQENLEAKLEQLKEDAQRAIGEVDARERERLRSINEDERLALQALSDELAAAQKALDEATASQVDAAQKRLDDAQRRLQDALGQAEQAADEAGGGPVGTLKTLLEDLAGTSGSLADKVATRGTFNASALQSLQSGAQKAADTTAQATAATAINTKKLVDQADSNRLTFG